MTVLLSSVFWKKNEDLVLRTDGQHLGKRNYRVMGYLGKYRTPFPNYLLLVFSTRDILAGESESSESEKTNSSPGSSNLYFIRFHNLSA